MGREGEMERGREREKEGGKELVTGMRHRKNLEQSHQLQYLAS